MDRLEFINISKASLGAHLYPSEEVLVLTEGVGLYSGPSKSPTHDSGTIYLTNYRLFYIDDRQPHKYSGVLPLSIIRQTQFFAGFLKSSPKITLAFKARKQNGDTFDNAKTQLPEDSISTKLTASNVPTQKATWVCRVCAFSNAISDPLGDDEETIRCQLCGVPSKVKEISIQGEVERDSPSNYKTSVPQLVTEGIACPVCTFSNHPSMHRCEMCDALLGTFQAPQIVKQDLRSGEAEQNPETIHNSIRLSFRKGGYRAFYDLLKTALQQKQWQRSTRTPQHLSQSQSDIDGRSPNGLQDASSRRVGIEGIFSAVDLQSREDSSTMQDALHDLEALMQRARNMVDFAEALNAKLTRQEAAQAASDGSVSPKDGEAANVIRTSLVRLGLPSPAITSDMARDEFEYNLQLAKEFAGLLYSTSSPILGRGTVLNTLQPISVPQTATAVQKSADTKEKGILALDEAWCIWNRARGVALVSPKQILAVVPFLHRLTQPQIHCKTFASGFKVLHTPRFADDVLSDRICAHLKEDDERWPQGLSTLQLSHRENCPLYLMEELLGNIEKRLGAIVRDEHGGQCVWYLNYILTQSL